MVTISSSTLRQNLFETLYDSLTAANLLSSTATVTAAFHDDEEDFPQVVIHPVNVSTGQFGFGRGISMKDISVLIDIWTTGSHKNKQKDQLADEIVTLLNSLFIDGVVLTGITESDAYETVGGSKFGLKSLTVNYIRKGG